MHEPNCGGQHAKIRRMAVGIRPMAAIVPMVRAERGLRLIHVLAVHDGNRHRRGVRHAPCLGRANVSRNRKAREKHHREQQERKQPSERTLTMLHESLPTSVFTLVLPNRDRKAGKNCVGRLRAGMMVIQEAAPKTPAFSTEAHWKSLTPNSGSWPRPRSSVTAATR